VCDEEELTEPDMPTAPSIVPKEDRMEYHEREDVAENVFGKQEQVLLRRKARNAALRAAETESGK
jgi:hypothetical protein